MLGYSFTLIFDTLFFHPILFQSKKFGDPEGQGQTLKFKHAILLLVPPSELINGTTVIYSVLCKWYKNENEQIQNIMTLNFMLGVKLGKT